MPVVGASVLIGYAAEFLKDFGKELIAAGKARMMTSWEEEELRHIGEKRSGIELEIKRLHEAYAAGEDDSDKARIFESLTKLRLLETRLTVMEAAAKGKAAEIMKAPVEVQRSAQDIQDESVEEAKKADVSPASVSDVVDRGVVEKSDEKDDGLKKHKAHRRRKGDAEISGPDGEADMAAAPKAPQRDIEQEVQSGAQKRDDDRERKQKKDKRRSQERDEGVRDEFALVPSGGFRWRWYRGD
jgi:hypothetical protein